MPTKEKGRPAGGNRIPNYVRQEKPGIYPVTGAAGGNENGADDMGAFVRHCDRLRAQSRAHVLIIHHAGKDEGRGAAGAFPPESRGRYRN